MCCMRKSDIGSYHIVAECLVQSFISVQKGNDKLSDVLV